MFYIILAAVILIADILTKIAAERFLMPIGTLPVIDNFFHLTYVENKGIAFGMFSGGRVIFIIISLIVLILLCGLVIKTEKPLRTVWLKCGVALVISGAVGNLIDRLLRGYVVDFLDFCVIDFPVFNIADVAVCIGAGMLLIHFLFAEGRARANMEKLCETEDVDIE